MNYSCYFAIDAVIKKKTTTTTTTTAGTTTFIISNKQTNDIIKIFQVLEDSNVLPKGVTEKF